MGRGRGREYQRKNVQVHYDTPPVAFRASAAVHCQIEFAHYHAPMQLPNMAAVTAAAAAAGAGVYFYLFSFSS